MIDINKIIEEIAILAVSQDNLTNILTVKNFISNRLILIDEMEGKELIKTHIKERFKFNSDVIKDMVKHYKLIIKANSSRPKETTIDLGKYLEETRKEFENPNNEIFINPSQDFINNEMIYSLFKGRIPYIITSGKKLIKFEDAEKFEYNLRNNNVSISKFRPQAALAYIEGKTADIYECYNKIKQHITKYIVFQDKALYSFLSLWVIGTYIHRVFRYYPYIWLNADKGSGKTRVMEVLSPIAFNSAMASNQTQSTIFRSVDADSCTLFIDEFEKMAGEAKQGILTVLNSGFNIESGKTPRMEKEGDIFKLKTFWTYSPKVFAGINDISDVLQDRCIKIRMVKKKKDDQIARYKLDTKSNKFISDLVDDIYICGLMYGGEIKKLYDSNTIEFPSELSDRECDIWEVIFTIARFIDTNNGTSLEETMRNFAIKTSKERTQDNIEKNQSYKLISILADVIPTIKPIKQIKDNRYYNSDDVFLGIKETDEFEWVKTKSYITTQLKNRFGIEAVRLSVNGNKVKVYCISDKHLSELLERYNIISIEQSVEEIGV